jgi:hypothetical protein
VLLDADSRLIVTLVIGRQETAPAKGVGGGHWSPP